MTQLPVAKCKSCNARIVWFVTTNGARMPVDADTVEPEDDQLDLTRHKSHFATCPHHNQHRRAK